MGRDVAGAIGPVVRERCQLGAVAGLDVIGRIQGTMVGCAGIWLPVERGTPEEGVLHIKIRGMAAKIGVESVVSLGDVERVPLARVDSAWFLLDSVPSVIDLPHGEGDVNEVVDLWQFVGQLEPSDFLHPLILGEDGGGHDGCMPDGDYTELHVLSSVVQ